MTHAETNISTTIATGVVSFASGFATGYLLEKYRERTRTKTALSENIYRPLHVELTLFLGRIAEQLRPEGSITWQTIKAGGLTKLINKKLRERIDLFYSVTLPEYEAAWQACEKRINAVREQWDEAYGTPPGGAPQRDINWFNFLVASECILPLTTINEGEALRIRNRSVLSYWLRDHDISPERFLEERWSEVKEDTVIVTYREKYEKAVKDSKKLLSSLQKEISV